MMTTKRQKKIQITAEFAGLSKGKSADDLRRAVVGDN